MTNENKHTPGPWVFNPLPYLSSKGRPNNFSIRNADNTVFIQVASHNDTEETSRANAHLIAAAPESHKANQISFSVLTDVYQYLYMNPSTDPALEKLMDGVRRALNVNKEAIVKATGQAVNEGRVTLDNGRA